MDLVQVALKHVDHQQQQQRPDSNKGQEKVEVWQADKDYVDVIITGVKTHDGGWTISHDGMCNYVPLFGSGKPEVGGTLRIWSAANNVAGGYSRGLAFRSPDSVEWHVAFYRTPVEQTIWKKEQRAKIIRDMKETQDKQAKDIADAKVPTEQEMREAKVPTAETIQELTTYINSLVTRPHDYGTCVYAMSMAATATFNFVASQLGVTGFQASCADLDILKRTRGLKWGMVRDYNNLLYPQYLKEFKSADELLHDPEIRDYLAKEARKLLAKDKDIAAKAVRSHWKMLADWKTVSQHAE